MMIIPGRLDRAFELHQKEYEDKAIKVLREAHYILGKEVSAFETEYAEHNKARYCVGVASGLDALQLAIRTLNIGKGDEVIVQANTYIASIMGITMNKATPVFVEPDQYYNIDASKIEEKVNEKTKAIMVVHLYGQASNMNEIMKIAQRYNLKVVEDCAQSHDACCNEKKTGTFGAIGCFSFYPTKNLGAFGDAGAILTDNQDYANHIRMLRNYGSNTKYHFEEVGLNSRLDEIQAGLLRVRLSHMDQLTAERRTIASFYHDNIHNELIQKPTVRPGCTSVWHQYVITCERRDHLKNYLEKKGIGTLIHYPIPPHLSEAYQYLGYKPGDYPITEKLSNQVLSLPIYNGMTDDEMNIVVDAINNFQG